MRTVLPLLLLLLLVSRPKVGQHVWAGAQMAVGGRADGWRCWRASDAAPWQRCTATVPWLTTPPAAACYRPGCTFLTVGLRLEAGEAEELLRADGGDGAASSGGAQGSKRGGAAPS